MVDKSQNPPPSQSIEGNQQNISGQVTGSVVGGDAGQIGNVYYGPVTYQTGAAPSPDVQPRHYFTVPFPRNAGFVGRELDLTTLHTALSGDEPVAIQDANARLLLHIAGQLPEAAQTPTARLGLLAGLDGEERPGRPSRLQRVLGRLEALSLVEELSGDELRLRPLVREFAAGQTPSEARDDFRRECAARLLHAYGEVARLERQARRLRLF